WASCRCLALEPDALEDPHIRIEPVDPRNAGRHLDVADVVVGNVLEQLSHSAKYVLVRDNQHASSCRQLGHDRLLPVRQHPAERVLEALRPRQLLGREVRVKRIKARKARIALPERWRLAPVVGLRAADPQPVAKRRRKRSQPLKCAVVALVQSPAAFDAYVLAAELLQDDLRCDERSPQYRGVTAIERISALPQKLCGLTRFLHAARAQVDIGPPGEASDPVPLALAVPEEDQRRVAQRDSVRSVSARVRSRPRLAGFCCFMMRRTSAATAGTSSSGARGLTSSTAPYGRAKPPSIKRR